MLLFQGRGMGENKSATFIKESPNAFDFTYHTIQWAQIQV